MHSDAGSQLISEDFVAWGKQPNVSVEITTSAPYHQEQNGMPERHWQTCRMIAFKLLTHARLHLMYFDVALSYAWKIHNMLPLSGCSILRDDDTIEPSTPHYLYFGCKPNLGRFRVFGCPCIAKVYRRKETTTGRMLDSKTLVQRGVRGVFVGFPMNQAGWLVYVPASGEFLVSADVAFDEDFSSTLAYNHFAFHDALPTRTLPGTFPDFTSLARTGIPPIQFLTPTENAALGPWCPHHPHDSPEDPPPFNIAFELTDPIAPPLPLEEGENELPDVKPTPEGTYILNCEIQEVSAQEGSRPITLMHNVSIATALPSSLHSTCTELFNIIQTASALAGEPGSDPTPFLPEPRTVKSFSRIPIFIQKAWIAALVKEITGLVFKRKVFAKEDPQPGEKVLPLTEVFKTKLDQDGMIDKLKARICFRGDLYIPMADFDPYSPHADWISTRLFLAFCAYLNIFPSQVDFVVMAYVQATMRERVFAQFPAYWAEFLPDELKPWIGRPLLLLKALYGYTYSGKFLYEAKPTLYAKRGSHHVPLHPHFGSRDWKIQKESPPSFLFWSTVMIG